MKLLPIILPLCLALALSGCQRGFEPIEYGRDSCAHCKMTIMDHRYAAELVTAKGRAYKFDDVRCLKQQLRNQEESGHLLFVESFLGGPNTPVPAAEALYLQHEYFSSPMNGNSAAFATRDQARLFMDSLNIQALTWEELD